MTGMKTSAEDRIVDLRESIDDLDMEIIKMLIRRRGYSQAIQVLKAAEGMTQVDLKRENEILAQYESLLFSYGHEIATYVLKHSKAQVR